MALPDTTWDKIKQEYLEGKSINRLSIEHSVSKSTISVRAKNEQWENEQKKTNSIVQDEVGATRLLNSTEIKKRTLDKPTKRAIENLKHWELIKQDKIDDLEKTLLESANTITTKTMTDFENSMVSHDDASKVIERGANVLHKIKKSDQPDTIVNNQNNQQTNLEPPELNITIKGE